LLSNSFYLLVWFKTKVREKGKKKPPVPLKGEKSPQPLKGSCANNKILSRDRTSVPTHYSHGITPLQGLGASSSPL